MRLRPTVALLALAAWTGAGGCGPEAPAPPGVLLLTVDTLRSDRLGSYGHPLETSPTLDALAARGVRFADATVQWPKTWPSMASMLTGTWPTQTGVRHAPRRPLPGRNRTLAEILREAGYQTAAVVSNVNLGRRFGFDQGFDVFVESWMEEYRRLFGDRPFRNRPGRVKRFTNATIVTDQGLRLLDALEPGRPFLLWLHYMDPHGPYQPPSSYAELFDGAYEPDLVPLRRLPVYQRQRDPRTGLPITDLARYRERYDGEVRYLDAELGRLLEEVEARGLDRNLLIVFTADHGETFDEHVPPYLEHGFHPFQSGASVPWLMVHPDLPQGVTVDVPVGLVDLVPTVLDVLGMAAPPGLAGRSLLPRIAGAEATPERPVFLEAGTRQPAQRAVRRGRWKLVHLRAPGDRARYGPEWQLFDLETDPAERRNVIHAHPGVAAELRAALEAYEATRVAEEGGELRPEDLDEGTREMLRSLGYVE